MSHIIGNIVVILIVSIILGAASYKLYINKKNNIKCSGCTACVLNQTCDSSETQDQ